MKRFAIMTAGVALALGVAAAPAVAAAGAPAPFHASGNPVSDLLGKLLGGGGGLGKLL
ncbi:MULTISPECIES: hypothetical protein [Nonomuraea]|uniref:DUF320 domain-containing protein n=1 Tax=Nonomuraea mangrovi TaxID=2316207 RepID=A0ABW4SVN4_9ACTN